MSSSRHLMSASSVISLGPCSASHVRYRWLSPASACTRARTSLIIFSSASDGRSEEHTSELQSLAYLVCRLLLARSTTEFYTLSLHDALPICADSCLCPSGSGCRARAT